MEVKKYHDNDNVYAIHLEARGVAQVVQRKRLERWCRSQKVASFSI